MVQIKDVFVSEWLNKHAPTLKERIRLIFRPLKKHVNVEKDCTVITYYKEMNGCIYIIKGKIKWKKERKNNNDSNKRHVRGSGQH